MSDMLVELSQNPLFRTAVKSMGLPLPTPQKLRRPRGARVERPLQDRNVVVSTGGLSRHLAACLPAAGANPIIHGAIHASWTAAGEAYGRPPRSAEGPAEDQKIEALVFDGTGLKNGYDLRALYDFFNPWLSALKRNGRAIVIGREGHTDPAAAGASAALDGFARSLAKELGRKGATAHSIFVPKGGEARLAPVLEFLLSDRSSFLSGQPWHLSKDVKKPELISSVRPLDGQTALVTGAARGIGEATAHLLAAEGAHVICLDRPGDEGPMSKVAREVEGSALAVDITAPDAAKLIRAFVKPRFGTLDVLIHNAGITRDKTLARMKPEWWDQAVAVNFAAVVDLNRALLGDIIADGARITCLSSVSGIAGNVGQTNYSASKAGLVGYVKALAATVAERGISVNAVAPGFIETRLTAAMPAVPREVGRRLSALGQGGQPRDVGELLTFLSTPGAYGLSGQTLRACGGMFIGA